VGTYDLRLSASDNFAHDYFYLSRDAVGGTDIGIINESTARTLIWTGGQGTSFNDAANWDDATTNLDPAPLAPDPADIAEFLTNGGAIGGGGTVAAALVSRFGDLDRLMAASEEDLAAVEGIGSVIAASLARYFGEEANRAMVERLRAGGVRFTAAEAPQLPQTLFGKTVVVTGTLSGFTREQAEADPARRAAEAHRFCAG